MAHQNEVAGGDSLTTLATEVAVQTLRELAIRQMHFFKNRSRESLRYSLDTSFLLGDQYGASDPVKTGLFKGLYLESILNLVFTEEAVQFLLHTPANTYYFWRFVLDAVSVKDACCGSSPETSLPVNAQTARERVFQWCAAGPFGNRELDTHQRNYPKVLELLRGGFDLSKLSDPIAVVEWLECGFILIQAQSKQAPTLVLNPFWEDWVEQLKAAVDTSA